MGEAVTVMVELSDEWAKDFADLVHDKFEDEWRSWRQNRNAPEDAAEDLKSMRVLNDVHKQLTGESLFEEFGVKESEDP
jgi:hypothetical protein